MIVVSGKILDVIKFQGQIQSLGFGSIFFFENQLKQHCTEISCNVVNTAKNKRTQSNGQDTAGKCVRFQSTGFHSCTALTGQVFMPLRQDYCCWVSYKRCYISGCTLSFLKSDINR